MAPSPAPVRTPEQQRKANLRLGLILATVALCFGLGFVARYVLLRGH